jgi:hypothetical protein
MQVVMNSIAVKKRIRNIVKMREKKTARMIVDKRI